MHNMQTPKHAKSLHDCVVVVAWSVLSVLAKAMNRK